MTGSILMLNDQLLDSLKKHVEQYELKPVAKAAWDKLLLIGMPTKKLNAYRYFPVNELLSSIYSSTDSSSITLEQVRALVPMDFEGAVITTFNGAFRKDLSLLDKLPSSIILSSTEEAERSFGQVSQRRKLANIAHESDPLQLMNLTIHKQGVFFYVPPKCVPEVSFCILHIVDASIEHWVNPYVEIIVGRHAKVKVFEEVVAKDASRSKVSISRELLLEENSELDLYHNFSRADGLYLMTTLRAEVRKDSKLTSIGASARCQKIRQDNQVRLNGCGALAIMKGIAVVSNRAQSYIHTHIEHLFPDTHSTQHFKVLVQDGGKSCYEGRIFVDKIAQKTQAYQLNNHLLMGEFAQGYSQPNLEIFADDVKASHGSTATQIDLETLFYLTSRGLSEVEAKKLLSRGFCQEILDLIPSSTTQTDVLAGVMY